MNDNEPSVARNAPMTLPAPTPPEPLGEVQPLAADDKQTASVSVLRNQPETLPAPTPPEPLGEVMAGASNDTDVPPSLLGTSFDPTT